MIKRLKICEITRTEVFFTASLYFASLKKQEAMKDLLVKKLGLNPDEKITDSGFEVCFLRDCAHEKLIEIDDVADNENINLFKKQTFDNVYVLSESKLILIEAKAHEGFSIDQIENMEIAKQMILKSSLGYDEVYLVGIHSKKYTPQNGTRKMFSNEALITWEEIADKLGDEDGIFKRANDIYKD